MKFKIVLLTAKFESSTIVKRVILAKVNHLNMESEPYLKDFMRPTVLKIHHGLEDRQELIKKKSMKLMIFFKLSQDQVFNLLPKASSISQTITYRIMTEHLLLKLYKAALCPTAE